MRAYDKKRLIAELNALKDEFVGFPKEQATLDDAILYVDNSSLVPNHFDAELTSAQDLLKMARLLGLYCESVPCGDCVFSKTRQNCPNHSWRHIQDDVIVSAEHPKKKQDGI